MFKKILMPIAILGMLFFVQCTDDPIHPDTYNAGKGNGYGGGGSGGGGGNGNGNGGGNGGNGGAGGLYGDLVICLRTPDGMPVYTWVMGEQDELQPAPQPIKIDETTLEPVKDLDGNYEVFSYDQTTGELIPEEGYLVEEVEFGRLNLVRAPQAVLDQALQEAKNALLQGGVSFITTDASGRLVAIIGEEDWLVNYDDDPLNDEFDDKTIDSPRENVAIYQELMSRGFNGELGFLNAHFDEEDILMLAAGAISAGADKTGTMNVDEFGYMNNWLLHWDQIPDDLKMGPDDKDRMYFNYDGFEYDRNLVYAGKYVRVQEFYPNGTWEYNYVSLYDVVNFTDPNLLIDYAGGNNTGITGFSNAADDAIQVLEFIHESTLVEYSPYFDDTWNND